MLCVDPASGEPYLDLLLGNIDLLLRGSLYIIRIRHKYKYLSSSSSNGDMGFNGVMLNAISQSIASTKY